MTRVLFTLAITVFTVVSVIAQEMQKSFLIKGTMDTAIQTDSVFIYIGLENKVASAPVVNGVFELKGSVTEPQNAMLAVKIDGERRRSGNLILENAVYSYSREGHSIKIKGGYLHDMVLGFESSDQYENAVSDYENTTRAIFNNKEEGYEPTVDERNKIREKMSAAIAIENNALSSIIEGNDSPLLAKVFALGRTQDWENYPSEKRVELFDFYEKELGHPSLELTTQRNVFLSFIEQDKMTKTVSVGSLFKDVEAIDINQTTVKLSDIVAKNKYTILEFWASWCGPCRGEIPNLKKAYVKYKSQGLEIYSISIDKDEAKWLKALQEEDTKWIQVLEKENATKKYGVSGVPASFLINQDGKILATGQELRGSDLDKTLGKYVSQ